MKAYCTSCEAYIDIDQNEPKMVREGKGWMCAIVGNRAHELVLGDEAINEYFRKQIPAPKPDAAEKEAA